MDSDKPPTEGFKILKVTRKPGDPLGTTVRMNSGSMTGNVASTRNSSHSPPHPKRLRAAWPAAATRPARATTRRTEPAAAQPRPRVSRPPHPKPAAKAQPAKPSPGTRQRKPAKTNARHAAAINPSIPIPVSMSFHRSIALLSRPLLRVRPAPAPPPLIQSPCASSASRHPGSRVTSLLPSRLFRTTRSPRFPASRSATRPRPERPLRPRRRTSRPPTRHAFGPDKNHR